MSDSLLSSANWTNNGSVGQRNTPQVLLLCTLRTLVDLGLKVMGEPLSLFSFLCTLCPLKQATETRQPLPWISHRHQDVSPSNRKGNPGKSLFPSPFFLGMVIFVCFLLLE